MTLSEALAVSAAAEPRYEAGAWCSPLCGGTLTVVRLRSGRYSLTECRANYDIGGPRYLHHDALCLDSEDYRSYHWFCDEGDPDLARFNGLDWHPAYGADDSAVQPAQGARKIDG